MLIGSYIENRLTQQNLTKQDLHQSLKRIFSDQFTLAYNTFSQKIANNNLNALELFQIACVLDIDLNELTNSLKQKFNISIQQEKEKIANLDLDSRIFQMFLDESPYLKKLKENQSFDFKFFSFKIIKRQKNLFEMISLIHPEYIIDKACRVELLDLDKQEIRVVACCDNSVRLNPDSLRTVTDWENFGQLIKKQSETQFILFPEILSFKTSFPVKEEGCSIDFGSNVVDVFFSSNSF